MTDEEMAEDFANSFDYTDNSNYENNYQTEEQRNFLLKKLNNKYTKHLRGK